MKHRILFIALSVISSFLFSQSVTGVDTLLKNGPVNKRINIVTLGDGYTSGQISQYITDATTTTNYLLNTSPFSNYKNYFNVFSVKCVSSQSGVSHPATASDVPEPVIPVSSVTNYFGSSFDVGSIHRLLVCNSSAVVSVLAANFPAYNQIIVLGNSTEYGGSGGFMAETSMHPSSKEILVHEIGHSFAGLADEYWAGPSYAQEKPNMTANSNTATIKWSSWLGINNIAVNAHGTSSPQNAWFKPHTNCKMQYLNSPFCSVCKQAIIEKIHSLTNPIDSYYPSNASTVSFTNAAQTFSTQLILPIPNTLKTMWLLNSANISNNTNSVVVNNSSLVAGTNTLKFMVTDTTDMSKDITNHPLNHNYSVIWNINNSTTGLVEIEPRIEFTLFPNPASNSMNFKYTLVKDAIVKLSIQSPDGKRISSKNIGRLAAGTYTEIFNIEELSSGNYFLSIQINNQNYNNQFIINK